MIQQFKVKTYGLSKTKQHKTKKKHSTSQCCTCLDPNTACTTEWQFLLLPADFWVLVDHNGHRPVSLLWDLVTKPKTPTPRKPSTLWYLPSVLHFNIYKLSVGKESRERMKIESCGNLSNLTT